MVFLDLVGLQLFVRSVEEAGKTSGEPQLAVKQTHCKNLVQTGVCSGPYTGGFEGVRMNPPFLTT